MRHLNKFLLLSLAAIVQCKCAKDPVKVIAAMNGESPNLRLVFVHRGVHTRGVVENSVAAVDAAAKTDADGVELDVQIAKDGSLWPCHDTRVGRTTNYRVHPNDPLFDILKDDAMGPKNPKIRDFTYEQLNALFLRDKEGNVLEGVSLHSLEFLLNHIKAHYPKWVVILDVKSADAVTPTADLVNKLGMQKQSVIKFLATWIPPSGVDSSLKGVKYVVVAFVDMLDGLVEKGTGPDPKAKVESYFEGYLNKPNYASIEPPTKNWEVSGEVVKPSGPGGFLDDWLINVKRRGIGKFHQTKDYNLGNVNSLGHCCKTPDEDLATSRNFGRETPDLRADANLLLKAADWVTTDAPDEVLADAVRGGFRLKVDSLC